MGTITTLQADVAIIGAGTAGMGANAAARHAGKHVVLINGGPWGTTCARVGCMPSKLLIAAADAAHALRTSAPFGVHAGAVTIDGVAVMRRVRAERDRFVALVLEGLADMPLADRVSGHARFTGPNELLVDDHTRISATSIVIATGSAATVPDDWKKAGPRVIVSDAVFDWTDLPASVAVVGSGIIGLELGQALHRLGVRVTIFGRGTSLAQLTDPDVLDSATKVLGAELDLRMEHDIVALAEHDSGASVLVASRDADGVEHEAVFDYVLVATGRSPNVAGLGLEHAGLALDEHGVPLYDSTTQRCGDSAVFIAGDADDERPLLPVAAEQGRTAGDNAARYPDVRPAVRSIPLAVVFCDPQIASAGASFKQLQKSHAGRLAIGAVSFADQGRSRVMLQNHGVLRLYAELGTGRFLGAEMFGPRAEHIGHLLAWACQAKLTVAAMLEMPFYHPVVEEGVRTALRELAHHLSKHPETPACTDCTPGI